jgi:hypothetical protein
LPLGRPTRPTLTRVRGRSQPSIGERAAELESLKAALHRAHDRRDGSKSADAVWRDAAAAFHLAVAALYEPYGEVLAGVRDGRLDAIEAATELLVEDPWCVRSGYLKAELMHALANAQLPVQVAASLRKVVLRRITDPQPRLLRYASQLAANLLDDELEADILRFQSVGSESERRAAERVIAGARSATRRLAIRGQRVDEAVPSHAALDGIRIGRPTEDGALLLVASEGRAGRH